jgi:hypothetical protein
MKREMVLRKFLGLKYIPQLWESARKWVSTLPIHTLDVKVLSCSKCLKKGLVLNQIGNFWDCWKGLKEQIFKVSPHSQFGDQKHNLWQNRRLDMNKTMEIMKFGKIMVPTIKDISIYFFHSKFITTYFFSYTSSPRYVLSIFQILKFWISFQYPTLQMKTSTTHTNTITKRNFIIPHNKLHC